MTLSIEDRGLLEKNIDSEIEGIKAVINIARNELNKKEWEIRNEADFALGWAIGSISANFTHNYVDLHHAPPSKEEVSQATEIITKRIREIKEAIFKCG